MQMCPNCDNVYDESDYAGCPYCAGILAMEGTKIKNCPECGCIMYWNEGYSCGWSCTSCDCVIYTGEEDFDEILDD